MAEEEKNEESGAGEASAGEVAEAVEEAAGGKGKKLIIIIVILVVVLGGAGAGLHFSGVLEKLSGGSKEEDELANLPQTVYYDLEEFLVNLNNPGKQVSFLKMTVTLELPNQKTRAIVENSLPKVRDSFQVYLRELRNSDLQGSAGIHRLREELLLRVNKVIEPETVSDILFKEMIVQ